MRVFVFLLILVNLLFLAWTQGYLGTSSNPDAYRVQQQLLADQVRVVARDEPPAGPSNVGKIDKSVEKKATDVCLILSDLPVADADPFETLLTEKLPAFKSSRTTSPGVTSYLVHIPPLASKQDVDNKVAELKKMKISDFFVIQESGANNRAISLGLFSTKEAATTHLEALRTKGVKSAKIVERAIKPVLVSIEIHGPETQADALNQAIADALPTSKPAACKTTTTP